MVLVPHIVPTEFRRVAHVRFWGTEQLQDFQATAEAAHADMLRICVGLDIEFAAEDVPRDLVRSVSKENIYTVTLI